MNNYWLGNTTLLRGSSQCPGSSQGAPDAGFQTLPSTAALCLPGSSKNWNHLICLLFQAKYRTKEWKAQMAKALQVFRFSCSRNLSCWSTPQSWALSNTSPTGQRPAVLIPAVTTTAILSHTWHGITGTVRWNTSFTFPWSSSLSWQLSCKFPHRRGTKIHPRAERTLSGDTTKRTRNYFICKCEQKIKAD